MKTHYIGIIMNGVTGRMGTNQHLLRSIDAIMKQGGVKISPNECIMPDPILVGRNETKLKALIAQTSVEKYTTDLDSVMDDPAYQIYFDAQSTLRPSTQSSRPPRPASTSIAKSPPRSKPKTLTNSTRSAATPA